MEYNIGEYNMFKATQTNKKLKNLTIADDKKKVNRSVQLHRHLLGLVKQRYQPAVDIKYTDILLDLPSEIGIPLRIYQPLHYDGLLPTIFYIPGTGFIAHELEITHSICSQMVRQTGCQLIHIQHRLAPENRYPAAVNDVYEVFRTMQQRQAEFQIDTDKIFIIGYSSGGNLAELLAIKAAQAKLPILHEILISPLLDLSREQLAYQLDESKDSKVSEALISWMIELYLPASVNKKDPEVSPMYQSLETLQGLPSVDVVYGEYDRCRSDSEAYVDKLQSAGRNVKPCVIAKGDHGLIWDNLEITKLIAQQVRDKLASVEQSLMVVETSSSSTVASKDEAKESEDLSPIPVSPTILFSVTNSPKTRSQTKKRLQNLPLMPELVLDDNSANIVTEEDNVANKKLKKNN